MTNDEKLETLWQEREVTKVILRFGRALDTGDWVSYRSCLPDRVLIDFERLTGRAPALVDADLLTRWAEAFQTPLRRHHTYSNFNIEIEQGHAEALVYMTARHWRPTDAGAAHNTQYGWYNFGLAWQDGRWLLTKIKHDFQWVDGNQGVVIGETHEAFTLVDEVFSPENQAAARVFDRT
ncbi:nuclear transport factor 2 family protein [Novosphingobium sp.]|uniref:nuclear transport factor 2 family protein n=1 Tax=Novosphingobium sp. TaxID=1874826 RepID=UPI003BA87D12